MLLDCSVQVYNQPGFQQASCRRPSAHLGFVVGTISSEIVNVKSTRYDEDDDVVFSSFLGNLLLLISSSEGFVGDLTAQRWG